MRPRRKNALHVAWSGRKYWIDDDGNAFLLLPEGFADGQLCRIVAQHSRQVTARLSTEAKFREQTARSLAKHARPRSILTSARAVPVICRRRLTRHQHGPSPVSVDEAPVSPGAFHMAFQSNLNEKATVTEIRQSLLAAGEYLAGLQTVEREKRDSGWQTDVRSAAEHIHGYDPILMAYERGYAAPGQGAGPEGGTALIGNENRMSAGQLVVGDNRYNEFAEKRVANATFLEMDLRGSLLVDNHEVRTTLDESSSANKWMPVGSPVDSPPVRRQARLFVRDVISTQSTSLASVPYIRELNATANEFGASSVAEGTTKPEVTMTFEQDDAPVRKIAAWIPATEEIIDDAPTLRGYIDTRLAYMLALREEFEILNGSGANPRLKGILQFSGLQTQTFTTDVAITVGLAIGKIENVDGEPDGIAMNPIKYWTMKTTRSASQFDDGFGSGAPYGSPGNTLWGLPVIRSRVLTLNQCVVGSWRLGATLFDRLQTTIRIGNQHSTYFTENKVAILAEERVALAVHRPDFFVDTALA